MLWNKLLNEICVYHTKRTLDTNRKNLIFIVFLLNQTCNYYLKKKKTKPDWSVLTVFVNHENKTHFPKSSSSRSGILHQVVGFDFIRSQNIMNF